jgi:ABC-type Co2+ transport system permease subunit
MGWGEKPEDRPQNHLLLFAGFFPHVFVQGGTPWATALLAKLSKKVTVKLGRSLAAFLADYLKEFSAVSLQSTAATPGSSLLDCKLCDFLSVLSHS